MVYKDGNGSNVLLLDSVILCIYFLLRWIKSQILSNVKVLWLKHNQRIKGGGEKENIRKWHKGYIWEVDLWDNLFHSFFFSVLSSFTFIKLVILQKIFVTKNFHNRESYWYTLCVYISLSVSVSLCVMKESWNSFYSNPAFTFTGQGAYCEGLASLSDLSLSLMMFLPPMWRNTFCNFLLELVLDEIFSKEIY